MRVLTYLKKKWENITNSLVRHSKVVVSVCVTSIIFMALIFWIQMSHQVESLGFLGDNFKLQADVSNYENIVTSQSSYINTANKVIDNQRTNLKKSDDLIKIQGDVIQKLIQRLKELDDWPPRGPFFDPDSITRSEAI